MTMFYSPTTGGFYSEDFHGAQQHVILDPAWVRPTVQVPVDDGMGGTTLKTVPDETAVHPTITVPNPNCAIPTDAVAINDIEHSALIEAQSTGKRIQYDPALGKPVAVDPPAQSLAELRATACEQLDMLAERVRSRYLTSAPLQAATYINKAKDALNYKQAGYPTPLDVNAYPYVDAEMRAAGDTTAKVAADRILTESALYDSVKGAAIEYERRLAKINVNKATTPLDIEAAAYAGHTALNLL